MLLSVLTLQAEAQSQTYRVIDPSTGKSLECDRCPPGTYLRERCTSTRKTQCAKCPPGSFTELWNYIPKCLRCGVCGENQVVKTACASDTNCKCQCTEGYYYKKNYDMCLCHSKCQPGEGVLAEGTPDNDTVCQVCPNGTFSDTVSAHHKCKQHTSCDAPGHKLLLKGSTWHDSVCADCGNLLSTDGADYLREILPAFFVHQNMHIRRLRRLLHKLDDGNRPTETSGHNVSGLHERVRAWFMSATASQIRQVPEILKKVEADSAAKRLHNKLQKIDSNLKALCSLGNEVDDLVNME
ncbi:tumor necrosis factor receptor superfamily member 6B-like isoform X2 [Anabas testudineus]|nr:tumor necrosis factor receptor superfamily member 6B-like isoform X2 [Anabas testudineus]